jgi:ABC-2 type transport system ATP-binding protein
MGYVPWKNRTAYVKHMGAVFGQKSQLIFDIPPVDSFRMNKAIYEIPDDEYNKRLNMLVELLELEDKVMRPTRVLSLGERMKCEFIMAMLHNPKIVFLDEPTIGLDVIAKHNIREFIKDMNKKGTTFILTTHDLEDVEQLARKVVIINKGEKVFDNSIQDLRRTLGNKKIVELTLTKKLGLKKNGEEYLLGIEGTRIIEGGKDLTMKIEVDIDTIPISQFISSLSELCEFSDISIKELPMEKIITNIYKSDVV